MKYLNRARKAWDARRWTSALDRTENADEFRALVSKIQPADFLYWESMSWQKTEEVGLVLPHLDVDVTGKRVLDLGPGYGDSLDVFHARGASECWFVESDPFLFTHNRHKPYATGVRRDFYRWLPDDRFDVIWIKGSVSPLNFWRRSSAARWVASLVRRVGRGGRVLLCPFWARNGIPREEALRHWFAKLAMDHGFTPLPYIPGHNERWFPASFRFMA